MEAEPEPVTGNGQVEVDGQNGDAPESEQAPQKQDGLLSADQQELSERVAHLEKRVREQEDEIVCLKGALADVMRRIGQVETTKAQNSLLPSKLQPKSPRRAPSGQERPKSMVSESYSHRTATPASPRPTPRGASASSVGKKWGSMSNSIDDANGHSKSPRHTSSQLTHAKRSTSHGSLPLKLSLTKGKESQWNDETRCVRMYMAGRPLMLYAPSNVEDFNLGKKEEPPQQELQLEWAYGYRGRDARSNLYMLPTGELLYFTAGVVVLHNLEEQTQRHYLKHTDDIKCIAVHPDQVTIASGQVAGHDKKEGKPHIRIWNSCNLEDLYIIGEGDFQRGVCCVSFSKLDGGKYICAVDESNDHTLSVWDWKNTKKPKVAHMKASGDPVTQCEFHPTEEDTIVMCGKSNISFWSLQGGKLNKKTGIFEKNEKPGVIICFAFNSNGDVLTGDSNGTIYVWGKGGNKITGAEQEAHKGAIFSLCVLPDQDDTILSGGKDGMICQWSSSLQKQEEAELPEDFGSVRMICPGKGKMLYIGTIRNCILQGNMEMKFDTVMVEGHKGELWGLDTHSDLPQFLTCGYDKSVYLWDSQTHSKLWVKETNYSAHCCCIHPTEPVAAVGMQSPKIIIVDLQTQDTLNVYTDGSEQVECIAFSPDGKKLAAGNRDNGIYVYNVSEDGRKLSKIGKCSGHSSYITHIDWDMSGEIIRSNCGAYECLYWRANKCKQEPDRDDIKDLEWATNSCTLTFTTLGIWPEGCDGTDINNCSVSRNRELVASADDFGKVNIYKYPCIYPKAEGRSYKGHSSHVTQAKFINNDTRLITCGGNDCTILQWKVE